MPKGLVNKDYLEPPPKFPFPWMSHGRLYLRHAPREDTTFYSPDPGELGKLRTHHTSDNKAWSKRVGLEVLKTINIWSFLGMDYESALNRLEEMNGRTAGDEPKEETPDLARRPRRRSVVPEQFVSNGAKKG